MSSQQRFLLGFACFFAGCTSSTGGPLDVSGTVSAQFDDGTETGFDFGDGIGLRDDRVDDVASAMGGHCAIGADGSTLDIQIQRPVPADGVAIRSFALLVTDVATTAGTVQATFGAEEASAPAGGACGVTITHISADDESATVEVQCDLATSAGTAHLAADLHFSGCDVID